MYIPQKNAVEKSGASRLAQHRVATHLPFEKRNFVQSAVRRDACAPLEALTGRRAAGATRVRAAGVVVIPPASLASNQKVKAHGSDRKVMRAADDWKVMKAYLLDDTVLNLFLD